MAVTCLRTLCHCLVAALLALASTSALAQQVPSLMTSSFIAVDEAHRTVQRKVRQPWTYLAKGQSQDDVRVEAARELERLVKSYESRGVSRNDPRIGVLLNDLGSAYATKATSPQLVANLTLAMTVLAPFVADDPRLALTYAQAAYSLAYHYALPGSDQSKVAEVLIEGVTHLRAKKADIAERALLVDWNNPRSANKYPGFARFLALAAGPIAEKNACPIGIEAAAAEAKAIAEGGRPDEGRKRAVEIAKEMIAAAKRGCDLDLQHGLTSVLDDSSKQPLIADLADATLRANIRKQPRPWARAGESWVSGYISDVAEHGSIEQLRDILLLNATRFPTAATPAPAVLLREFARQVVARGDYASAEVMFERTRELRPAAPEQNTDGWGAAADAADAARFHASYGKRSRATELARIVSFRFPATEVDPDDLAEARLMLARNALDEGDPVRAGELVRAAAADAATAGRVEMLQALFKFALSLPSPIQDELKPVFLSHATDMLTRFGKDTSVGNTRRHEHQPSMSLALDVAVHYSERSLFEKAKAVSAYSFSWMAKERRLPLVVEGNPVAEWFTPPPATEIAMPQAPERTAFEALYPLFMRRDYAALKERLQSIPTPNERYDCAFADIAIAKLVVQSRASGRVPIRADIEQAAQYRNCSGNTLSSVVEQLTKEMEQGSLWMSFGEPIVADLFYSRAIPKLLGGHEEVQDDVRAARDPEAPSRLSAWAEASFAAEALSKALSTIERATRLIERRLTSSGFGPDRAREASRFRRDLDAHVSIAALAPRVGNESDERDRVARALEAMQLSRVTATELATARLAVRLGGTDPQLGSMIRARQDLQIDLERENRRLDVIHDPVDRRRLTSRLAEIERQIRDLGGSLHSKAPALADAEDLRPMSLAAIREALSPGNALFVTHSTPTAVFVAVVTASGTKLEKVEGTRKEIAELVRDLRSGVNIYGSLHRFRTEAASELYRRLIAPFKAELNGCNHLTLVLDGALESLPFAVLVDEETNGSSRYLIEQYSLSVLPSVRAMKTLRSQARLDSGGAFLGVGDPTLKASDGDTSIQASALALQSPTQRVKHLKTLKSLPDTAQELHTLSRLLAGSTSDVWLADQATEHRVKTVDLSRFETLAFATHALVAGEFDGVGEPGLVLTPPLLPSADDDGLLTASEIASLQLSARLVILSACNTASADGTPGADGLSGLVRAFIAAGARSLIVTHWRVESTATAALIEAFGHELAEGKAPHTALRAAMLKRLSSGTGDLEHPALWGAFFVVGAGS